MWDMPHGWELVLTEWYKRFFRFALYFLQTIFLFYGGPLINITLLALRVLDYRAIKDASEAAPLPGC